MYFDFILYGESKNDNVIRVLLVVAKKEHLDPFFELGRFIIPGIAGIEPVPIARMNGVQHLLGASDADGRALIYLDNNRIEIDYAQKGITQSWRSVELSAKDTKTLAERIGHELKAAVRSDDHDESRIDVVIDGTVDVKGLNRHLRTESDLRVRVLNTEGSAMPSTEFSGAFGLALKGHRQVAMALNLLPAILRRKKSKAGYYLMLSLCVILLFSVGGLMASKVVYQGMVMERLHTELSYLKSEVRHVDAINAEISDLEKRIEFLDGMLNAYIPVSDILNELTIRIPESAWLKSMDFSGKTIKLRGDAQSASSLVSLLEASAHVPGCKISIHHNKNH